jgi:MoxR-like ATPase
LPGIGKTTLIKKIAEELKTSHPVDFYTTEIREARGDWVFLRKTIFFLVSFLYLQVSSVLTALFLRMYFDKLYGGGD